MSSRLLATLLATAFPVAGVLVLPGSVVAAPVATGAITGRIFNATIGAALAKARVQENVYYTTIGVKGQF